MLDRSVSSRGKTELQKPICYVLPLVATPTLRPHVAVPPPQSTGPDGRLCTSRAVTSTNRPRSTVFPHPHAIRFVPFHLLHDATSLLFGRACLHHLLHAALHGRFLHAALLHGRSGLLHGRLLHRRLHRLLHRRLLHRGHRLLHRGLLHRDLRSSWRVHLRASLFGCSRNRTVRQKTSFLLLRGKSLYASADCFESGLRWDAVTS
mmetsp:Transcript_28975/g.73244  ORF Transcript_28975/g.73244 Transcript_28975/m.73244 type:complete len:205 (+) Transcript_28975:306-920(+)